MGESESESRVEARRLPGRVHLPSGRVVRLSDAVARARAAEVAADGEARGEAPWLRDLRVLGGAEVVTDDAGAAVAVGEMRLDDAHVLRALLAWAGVVPEEAGEFTCGNCGEAFAVAPSPLLEVGPFTDGELHDPELDRPFDVRAWHALPALRVRGRVCRRVRFAERTVDEAMALLVAAGKRSLRITPAVAAAMGVTGLGNERRAVAIADALAEAPEGAWAAVVELYMEARYPARLVGVQRCAGCGARNDLDVPLERELSRGEVEEAWGRRTVRGRARRREAAFPDLDAFEEEVRGAAERVYRSRGVRNVDLFVDAGVPLCDDGGEPLLGCYTPGGVDPELGIARAPEVRVFYRSFEAAFREDPGFDVRGEIEETLDHEVTHHLHFLSGVDPLDEEERGAIATEEVRRVGVAESARRARRGALADVLGFLRVTWPLWVIAAAAAVLGRCQGP
ncbi:metallopeptidase family protein [Chondromyces apiculatus]|uniref:Uncharacterized protein n=1 Tax=Chondromyces apiculatus DSM 436 TaxID=1192034 RepID=A0A017SZG3_9BACT|nr:metallopeptidase family protein [Chondromyces apiculatus]EYF02363.1 Hypothetical protein CAP_7134 [Chondromyces apiculatus DSM 436]